MGDAGTEHRLSFTVIGDTVSVASRLQNLTRDLKTPLIVADSIVAQINAGQPDSGSLPIKLTGLGERELRGRPGTIRTRTADTRRDS